jgi:hypothetical protein
LPESGKGLSVPENYGQTTEKCGAGYDCAREKSAKSASELGLARFLGWVWHWMRRSQGFQNGTIVTVRAQRNIKLCIRLVRLGHQGYTILEIGETEFSPAEQNIHSV